MSDLSVAGSIFQPFRSFRVQETESQIQSLAVKKTSQTGKSMLPALNVL
jgi:hypothetical protein